MNVVPSAVIAALLLSVAGPSSAADARAVLAFRLPPLEAKFKAAKAPTCGNEVDLGKLLADPSMVAALVGFDPRAKLELDSNEAILRRLADHGRDTKRLLVHRVGQVAQCQSGCVVLPEGAHIREIKLSNRHAGPGASIIPTPAPPGLPKGAELPASGTASDRIDMGDYGYQGLQTTLGERAVCVTAKNWSATESSTQLVEVFFER